MIQRGSAPCCCCPVSGGGPEGHLDRGANASLSVWFRDTNLFNRDMVVGGLVGGSAVVVPLDKI